MKTTMIGLITLAASILSQHSGIASAQPDLAVTQVQFSPNPIYVGNWITTTVTVSNISQVDYTNQFLVDVQGTTVAVGSLAAGAGTNVTVPNAFAFDSPGTSSLNFGIIASDDNQDNDWIAASVTVIPDPNKPSVWITSPNGGERLTIGNKYTINTITAALPSGTCVLLLLHYQAAGDCKGGCEEFEDVIGYYAGGDYEWTVPLKYATSYAQIRAVLIGPNIPTNYPPQDYSDGYFTIERPIRVVSPAAGQNLRRGKTYLAAWKGREPNVSYYDVYLINIYTGKQIGAIFLNRVNAQKGCFLYTVPHNVPPGPGYRLWFVRPEPEGTGFTSDDFNIVHDNRKPAR